jgi:hypothetical protein
MLRYSSYVSLVVVCLLVAGCDLFGSSEIGCEGEIGSAQRGEATLRVQSDTDCRTIANGHAWFNDAAVDPAHRPAFFMEVGARGERGLSVFIARQEHERPSKGVHEVADLSKASPSYPGSFDIYNGIFSVIGYEIEGGPALTTSGTLTITRSDEEVVEGSFDVSAILDRKGERISLSGNFSASARDTPWQSY